MNVKCWERYISPLNVLIAQDAGVNHMCSDSAFRLKRHILNSPSLEKVLRVVVTDIFAREVVYKLRIIRVKFVSMTLVNIHQYEVDWQSG